MVAANETAAANEAVRGRNIKNDFVWFVPHYTPIIIQGAYLSMHLLLGVSTELSHIERSIFSKDSSTERIGRSNWGI